MIKTRIKKTASVDGRTHVEGIQTQLLCSKDQQMSCCCHYDPSEDDSLESRIGDLSFALKKLSVMKCQMKKWHLERLQLESQTRSLILTLQVHGIDVNEHVKSDPVITHFRNENVRLEKLKDELKEQVRDLTERLNKTECKDNDSNDGVDHLKDKILKIRNHHVTEKKQLRDRIVNLELQLREAQDENSSTVLNRLREKLGELMKDRKKGDQQMSCALEKSIETLVELSKGCDELRRENEHLLTEVETLKAEIKEDSLEEKINKESDLEKSLKSEEIANFYERIKTCENSENEMRLQLAEKNNMIDELQKKLSIKKDLSVEDKVTKGKLQKEVNKDVTMQASRKTSSLNHENDESTNQLKALENCLERVQKELREERVVNEFRRREIEHLREEKAKLEVENGVADMQTKIDSLCTDNDKLKAELESFRTEYLKLNKDANKVSTGINALTKEKIELMRSLECSQYNEEVTNKELEVTRQRVKELQSILANVTLDKDRLEREVGDFKWQLNKIKKDLEVELAMKNELQHKFKSTGVVLSSFTSSHSALFEELSELSELKKDTYEKSKDTYTTELIICKNELKQVSGENKQLKVEIEKLKLYMDRLKAKFKTVVKKSALRKLALRKLQLNVSSDLCKSESRRLEQELNKAGIEKDDCMTKFISVSETLKKKMELQTKGSITKKPEKSLELSLREYDGKDWLIPKINQLFETSKELTDTILKAEQEVLGLEDLQHKERKENQELQESSFKFFDSNSIAQV